MAAKAIEEYITKNYINCEIKIMDPLTYSRPVVNKLFAKIGEIIAVKFRKFRKNMYKKKMYQNYFKDSIFFRFCIKLFWTKKLKKELLKFNPNIIISTQVGPTGLIAAHKDLFKAKLISVFTDYGVHRMYITPHKSIDTFCVPNEDIKQQMIEMGIDKNKIAVTGIPVRTNFLMNNNKRENILKKYNLPLIKPFFLFVCGGGLGYSNAFDYFKKMLESECDFSYIFVSGKNQKLFKKAKSIASNYNKKGEVLGYVENIHELIYSSDMVIGKPGGIITSECLNLDTPICAVEPIPGQETNNALFIKKNKFGFYVTNQDEFKDLLNNIKINKINLEKYKENINKNFNKFSFLNIN